MISNGIYTALADLTVPFAPPSPTGLDDSALLDAQRSLAEIRRRVDAAAAVLAGEIEHRSRRELGYGGLAQRLGARTPQKLIQVITGVSSREASALVRVGGLQATSPWLREVATGTNRRPGVPGIDTGSTFPDGILFETPFPNTLDVANTLISTYLESARSPAQTLFVLDTSGSMEGDRLAALQQALKNLAGADDTTAGGFAAFRSRERVTLLPFNDAPESPIIVDVPDDDKTAALGQIRDEADDLVADGGTAIYDSLEAAYKLAIKQQKERPDTFVSIVLMTDGENTDGDVYSDFERFYNGLGTDNIATFVVLFGNANVDELTSVANLTGGKVFDALNGDLAGAFQEIRGYQ